MTRTVRWNPCLCHLSACSSMGHVLYYGSDDQQEPLSSSARHRSVVSVQLHQEATRLCTTCLSWQRSDDTITHLLYVGLKTHALTRERQLVNFLVRQPHMIESRMQSHRWEIMSASIITRLAQSVLPRSRKVRRSPQQLTI